MEYKIKPDFKTKRFAFLPRYCGNCGKGFWLMLLTFEVNYPSLLKCPYCLKTLDMEKSRARKKYGRIMNNNKLNNA